MGDRANIVIKDGDSIVYLYSHWGGYKLPETLGDALVRAKAEGRLDDGSYLARIIFSEMIKDELMDTTGYGISSILRDNEHDLIVINVDTQHVGLCPESDPTTPTTKWHRLVHFARPGVTWEALQ